jgi:valyl-tRNA synthetase
MEVAKTYNPAIVEEKWYGYWMDQGFFKSVPDDREPYTIVIPPPNVTGVLHMGHMLNNTIQDVLVRKARMHGKNACWVPGTDHASIATEARVVAMLKEKGIRKQDLSRDEFLAYAWEWKEKYGGIILEQLKKLGASCDWDRTRFTMEESLSDSVITVFIDLFNKGLIYRGTRMVNWDPVGLTAVSDEEVYYKDVNSKLYYVKYQISGEQEQFITIATTRPETILGDTAICVHPDDHRYSHLKGKSAVVPLNGRIIPIIQDEYVTMEFGTGCLKVTPAHDANDYGLGTKHNLDSIDIFNPDGTMSQRAEFFVGLDRFEARKQMGKHLDELGLISKIEDIKNSISYSERTHAVIEPRISLQWFMKMEGLAGPALENVMNDTIRLVPEKFKNTYRHWMENVRDWCISRQLWWGHRIPAYYLPDGDVVVARSKEDALDLAKNKSGFESIIAEDLKQDEDVLDTWFSSWIWPISVFDGFNNPDNPDIKYYYPTNDLVTAPEILFFWVARMIMAGYEYRGDKPFRNVYLTGIVRDKQGKKMSKSLGNSPEPLDLIEKYGADGVRVGMLLCSPAGNDLLFDENLCEQGRNFSNKIWNAYRLIQGWEVTAKDTPGENALALHWFGERIKSETIVIDDHFSKYRLSDALMSIYKLIWDDFCSVLLEVIKPTSNKLIDRSTYESVVSHFESLLKLLHPFMPFISEEIWQQIRERKAGESLMVAPWPEKLMPDKEVMKEFELVLSLLTTIRNIRKEKNIPNRDPLMLLISEDERSNTILDYEMVIRKMANVTNVSVTKEKVTSAICFMVQSHEFFIPFTESIDMEAEKLKILTEINYHEGFLRSVRGKLTNEKFMANAKPEIVASEKKKEADALAKINTLKNQLESMGVID